MKRILSIFAVAAIAFTFSACDLLDDLSKDRDTDSEIMIPDDSPSDDDSGKDNNDDGSTDGSGDNPGGGNDDNGGNNGDNHGAEGNTGDNTGSDIGDRSKYEQHNHSFTQGDAIYYGVYYEGQPSDVCNWWIDLADSNYSLED